MFLTMFRVDAASGRPVNEVSVPATDLLSTTRLYLDSHFKAWALGRDSMKAFNEGIHRRDPFPAPPLSRGRDDPEVSGVAF